MYLDPYTELFNCVELVERVASYLPWKAWVTLSNVDMRTRDILHGAVRTRMRFFITKFITWQSLANFYKLLESTNSLVAGSVVRCLMSVDKFHVYQDVNPLQLNIVVPFCNQEYLLDSGTIDYRRWRRFLFGCGYRDEYGSSFTDVPHHLAVTSKTWSVMVNTDFPDHKISLIQSRTPSALSPVLQACHTSNFFALSASRIYCLYPSLFAAKVNLATKHQSPHIRCAFDSFNYGLLSFSQTDEWNVFPGNGCGEACPSVWRRIRNLRGIGVYRWGGFYGWKDIGLTVSNKDNYGDMYEMWKVQGECCNQQCPSVILCTNLYEAIV